MTERGDMNNTPLPTLEDVPNEERPTPPVAEPPPFTLTAEVSTRRAHQPDLFAAAPDASRKD